MRNAEIKRKTAETDITLRLKNVLAPLSCKNIQKFQIGHTIPSFSNWA